MSVRTPAALPDDNRQFCPWEHFDGDWYAATHMPRPVAGEPRDPWEHYSTLGVARRHSPNAYFDEAWYRDTQPGVAAALAARQHASGFAHYCAEGYLTCDPHWLFSESIYRGRRGDLSGPDMRARGLRNGYHHYLIAGQTEATSGSSFFDPRYLADSLGITDFPFTTLLTAPWLGSVQISLYFDPDWYLAMYQQVEDLIADGHYVSPLHHYLTNPTPQAFAGSADFDEAFYSARYPRTGAEIATGAQRTGWQHFVDHGRFENRRPSPWFDPEIYMRHAGVAADLRQTPGLVAFDHYLRVGRGKGIVAALAPHERPMSERPGTEAAGKDIFLRMAHLWAASPTATLIRFEQPDSPDISVVICAFNQFDLTIQTLLHLSGSTGVRFEVILIDNASSDATAGIEARVQGLRLLRNAANAGFLRAANQGIEAATGRHVLLLNNDVILPPNALAAALARLQADPTVGAVGAKVVRSHGLLQEAGCILFSDGSALGYGRDADPFEPDYNFVRDVDFCSGVFLMLRRSLLLQLGGLDVNFAPAYYEEVDLCVRVWKRGLRVVYDPAIAIIHLEFGSSRNPDAPRALMRRNREILLARHRDWLSTKSLPDATGALAARTATRRRRVLMIEDTIPYRHTGSGFGRSAEIVAGLVALGHEVTVLPMNPVTLPLDPRLGFHEGVELLWNRDVTHAAAFFAEREYHYDVVWVCRAHNLHRLSGVIGSGGWGPFLHAQVVLDTEALAGNREAALATLEGRSFDLDRALRREMRHAYLAHDIVCVNAPEQAQLQQMGLPRTHILGHRVPLRAQGEGFAARRDILAIGALYSAETPNFDGLRWFIAQVWPLVRAQLTDVRLVIAGFAVPGLDVPGLLQGEDVIHRGFVEDPSALYAQSRVFLAPTRFAAGIPIKVHEAASYGVPVMASTLLADQLGWQSGQDLVAGPTERPQDFADALVRLYTDPQLWQSVRASASTRVELECGEAVFNAAIAGILDHGASNGTR